MDRRRILVEDARGADRHLRVTWHPEAGQFNVSTWHGDVCAGAVRVEAAEAARLIALLADGMAEAAAAPPAAGPAHRFAWADQFRALWRGRRSAG